MIKLTIQKLSNGGFIVMVKPIDAGIMDHAVFASTTIDEALAFIRNTLEPPKKGPVLMTPDGPVMQPFSVRIDGAGKLHPSPNAFGPNGS